MKSLILRKFLYEYLHSIKSLKNKAEKWGKPETGSYSGHMDCPKLSTPEGAERSVFSKLTNLNQDF